ncbi:putative zinc-binding alcohol dehydrogenase [Xylariaceae sp. FL0255]|nr:putative zinc-binding alcohol dehydrogenase [Xylariaceae sp. FL0255]
MACLKCLIIKERKTEHPSIKTLLTETTQWGWLTHDKSAGEGGNMIWSEFEPKRWEETDINIKVPHCGMRFTDLATVRSGWVTPTQYVPPYPIVAGHEIVGHIIGARAVGNHKVGDRIGVGCLTDNYASAQSRLCEACTTGDDPYRTKACWMSPGPHHYGDKGYGRYATYHRCPGHSAFKLLGEISSPDAATVMCADITCGEMVVGRARELVSWNWAGWDVMGFCPLGALGAEKVVAISRRLGKEKEALELGANLYIATDQPDLVIKTATCASALTAGYFKQLRYQGKMVQVGYPDDRVLHVNLEGSAIRSSEFIQEMLDLAAEKGNKSWIDEWPMTDANAVIVDLAPGKPRYRYRLVNKE